MNLAIIQARMGSSRLPGKVMKDICGKPLIGHMLERLKHCEKIDKFILATTDGSSDDLLADYVHGQGYDVYRGSEDNVLERFFLAASPYQPDVIVRLTGDCVLIEAKIVDAAIGLYFESSADYVWVDSSFAEGLDAEVFSFAALKEMHSAARLLSELEHVTQYIHNNKNKYKRVPLLNTVDDSEYRIVVDEPEDFYVATKIIEHFYNKSPETYIDFQQIKCFLDANPEIVDINRGIIRNEGLLKSLDNDRKIND